MRVRLTGLILIQIAAWSEIVVSVLIDGVIYSSAHMTDPLWLPHAKLHCAMSFEASIALGVGAVLLLFLRRGRLERQDLGLAAFLSCAFWICLITAGFWPGTSYQFADDPAFVDMQAPVVLGVTVVPNVALAVAMIACAAIGFVLAARHTPRRAVTSRPSAVRPGSSDATAALR